MVHLPQNEISLVLTHSCINKRETALCELVILQPRGPKHDVVKGTRAADELVQHDPYLELAQVEALGCGSKLPPGDRRF